jgi:hypothetical protein
MKRPYGLPTKLIILIGFLALLRMLLLPGAPASTPYSSALSRPSPEAGGGGCANKACVQGLDCVSAAGYKCVHFNGKGCQSNPC